MNEKEIMDLIKSMDNDLIDNEIDQILKDKGELIDMKQLKKKSMDKLNQTKKIKVRRKVIIAVAAAAVLTVSTVYAKDISNAVQSFFNKSVLYDTIVDGQAFYLPEPVELNDRFTLKNVSVSNNKLEVILELDKTLLDSFDSLNPLIIPADNSQIRYIPFGIGTEPNDSNASTTIVSMLFGNETGLDYNIVPFKAFEFSIDGESYDISLTDAQPLSTDNLAVGLTQSAQAQLIANVAGTVDYQDDVWVIQLAAALDDAELKLRSFGGYEVLEFDRMFQNASDGTVGMTGGSAETRPILAFDKNNDEYTLKVPDNAVGNPSMTFELDAKAQPDVTVALPAIVAGYEKEVAHFSFTVPSEGKIELDETLDFIIQKATIRSIERVSKDKAVVQFELNTGNEFVSITDLGAYSSDVIGAETVIKGNQATMTMTIDENIEHADFKFSWPNYMIQGNWEIVLVANAN